MQTAVTAAAPPRASLAILASLSLCHFLNDTMQSLLPAIYPVLQDAYALSFTEIGIIHFAFMATASLLQPAVGVVTDRRPIFRLATLGMGFTLAGILTLAFAADYLLLVAAAVCIGVGSSIFHPDSSRNARTASGGRFGFAQSLFQVGGNAGSAAGPLLAAFVVLPFGQPSLAWFSALALIGMALLWNVGTWARAEHVRTADVRRTGPAPATRLTRRVVTILALLGILVFSKYVYLASITSYYTFYLIDTFGLSVGGSQLMLFVFLAAVAAGTFVGGPVGDRIGRRTVIIVTILGVVPFTLLLPYANLFFTGVLSAIIGVVIASAFSAIIVYAQTLLPGRVGLVSGLFFGFAFGISGIGAAALGVLADATTIGFVFKLCALLPLLGIAGLFLPREEELAGA